MITTGKPYSRPEAEYWEFASVGLICQSPDQLEDLTYDDSEGIDF